MVSSFIDAFYGRHSLMFIKSSLVAVPIQQMENALESLVS